MSVCLALALGTNAFAKNSKMSAQLLAQVRAAKKAGVQVTPFSGCVSQVQACKYFGMNSANYSAAVLKDLPFVPPQYAGWVSAPDTPLNTPISGYMVGFQPPGPSILCFFSVAPPGSVNGDIVIYWQTTGQKSCPSK